MAEKDSVRNRLLIYLNNINEKKARFERNIGASNGYVNNIKNSISPEFLEKITDYYSDLNLEWLLIGRGNMTKEKETAKNTYVDDVFIQLFQEGKIYPASVIKEKDEEIARLNKEIGRLENLLQTNDINFKQTG
jgi:hypothetical protein